MRGYKKTVAKIRKSGNVNYSKELGKRFLTSKDMAETKKYDAMVNSMVKRGETVLHATGKHIVCQCGDEGCIMFVGL